jgi:hypothetical protein
MTSLAELPVLDPIPPAPAGELDSAPAGRPRALAIGPARRRLELALVVVTLLSAGADALGAPGIIRGLLTLAVGLLLPGAAILATVPIESVTRYLCLVTGASLAVEVLVSSAMIAAGWWHPLPAAVVLTALAAGRLILLVPRDREALAELLGPSRIILTVRGSGGSAVAWTMLAVATLLWIASLPLIHAADFGEAGLVGQAPFFFYIGLATVVGGAAVLARAPRVSGWLITAYVGVVILFLYCTIPAIAQAPQYAWTYKHIGVTELLAGTGHLHPGVDIYNRWPGMFSAAALFSAVTGLNPLSFAGWAEPMFAALEALGVAAIVLRLSGRRDVTGLSVLVWLVTNWIGQTYFSPQATAFVFDMTMMASLLGSVPVDTRVARVVLATLRPLTRRAQARGGAMAPEPLSRTTLGLVLTVDAAAVVTHQLTPYMIVLQLGVLTVLGLRPRWLLVAATVMTIGYLIPNAAWVQSHYGLFNGLNPVDNAQVQRDAAHRAWFYSHVGAILSFSTLILAGLGAIRLMRREPVPTIITIGGLGLAPFALLFANNYGGEGSARVFLFGSPWFAMLIGWALCTLRPRWRLVAVPALVLVLTGLFLFAFIGNAGTNVIPKDEVQASQYFYSHAPAHSVLMLAGEDFPLEAGPGYSHMAGPGGDSLPNLHEVPQFRGRMLGTRDLPAIAAYIRTYSTQGFLAFATTEDRYAKYFATTRPGMLDHLQQAVAASPMFTLWYRTENAHIYRLVNR